MSDFIHFADFIPKALRRYQVDRQARAALVCARFRELMPRIVGDDARAEVQPKFFKNGTLTVRAASSIWAQRVYVHRHELITQLNLHLEGAVVKDLRTVVE